MCFPKVFPGFLLLAASSLPEFGSCWALPKSLLLNTPYKREKKHIQQIINKKIKTCNKVTSDTEIARIKKNSLTRRG